MVNPDEEVTPKAGTARPTEQDLFIEELRILVREIDRLNTVIDNLTPVAKKALDVSRAALIRAIANAR
jgi:hypothetical protein